MSTFESNRHAEPPAHAIHNHEHPGEAMADTRGWPGYGLIAVAIVTLGMTLVAAGYGFRGWAFIAGTICVVSLVAGATLVHAEHNRVRRLDAAGVLYPYGR